KRRGPVTSANRSTPLRGRQVSRQRPNPRSKGGPEMIATAPDLRSILNLPRREEKPRRKGLTVVIDGGLPSGQVRDLAASSGHLIDLWKFGWGTSLVTRDLESKI